MSSNEMGHLKSSGTLISDSSNPFSFMPMSISAIGSYDVSDAPYKTHLQYRTKLIRSLRGTFLSSRRRAGPDVSHNPSTSSACSFSISLWQFSAFLRSKLLKTSLNLEALGASFLSICPIARLTSMHSLESFTSTDSFALLACFFTSSTCSCTSLDTSSNASGRISNAVAISCVSL
ncbi:hypothetical protein L7F22_032434 [Adiantum nelumboides]|nr:hypothetical protein [Adiantum nelumboides]